MKILSNEMAQHYQIASLKRGHLIFTSFIALNGKILFLDSHLDRLLKGADFLFPNSGWAINHQKLKQHVLEAFRRDKADSYFRLTLFDDCVYLERRVLDFSPECLKMTSALKVKTPGPIPSYLKVSNYLESDLELARAMFLGFDDVLYFDNGEHLTEASSSNVFIVTGDGKIKTPQTSSMVLEGITRQKLLTKLSKTGFAITEGAISKAELEKAREIWLTNSVKGVRFVSQFEDLTFERSNSIFEKAIALFGRYGELV
ncbi:MAG: aminotransferase class IV [Bacteriovorax sp.]